jgi:hypothetical protein
MRQEMPTANTMTTYRFSCIAAGLILVLAALAVPVLAQGEIGYVRVASNPPGAYVYIDNVYRATTASSGAESPVIDVTANVQHTIRISKSGYQDFTAPFTVLPGDFRDFQITLTPVTTPSTFGTIGVASTPGGAEVYIDGTYHGLTPTQSGTFLTQEVLPGQHTVSVQKAGHVTYSTKVDVTSGQRKDVTATLQSTQPAGAIQVTTSPSGATVTLDGLDPRTAPYTYQNVAPGPHTLLATLDGYEQLSYSVTVVSGATAQATLTLIRSPATVGSLHVTSIPSGADIYLDGIYRGPTPITIGNLAPGNHNILLRLAGYQEYTGTATIIAGQTTEHPVTLVALPPSAGSIDVVSYPAGASVYLDGSYYGQTSPYDALDIPNVAPGDHALVLVLEGYYNYVTSVAVTAGRSTSVVATLTDRPDANQFGQLAVQSSPSGAYIYVDGAYRGITPANLMLVRSGERTVLLRQSGYQDWTTAVTVTGGETAQVSATLAPIATPTPTPTPTATTPTPTTTAPATTQSGPATGFALAGLALAGILVLRARP